MGWIDDKNPTRSLRALAQALLDAPDCPDRTAKLDHLANMIRKADKGDSAWFFGAGRAWVPLLARLLVLEPDELRLRLQDTAPPALRNLVPIPGFEVLRPLDLEQEALPPGLLSPPRFRVNVRLGRGLVWWTLRAGTGLELVKRWADWQVNWRLVEAETWIDAESELGEGGRILVVLGSALDAPPEPPDLSEPLEMLWVICPEGPPLRVDSPETQQASSGGSMGARPQTSWPTRDPGHARNWLPALLDWVAERLPPGGGLDLQTLHDAMDDEKAWLYAHVVTFDDALELLALCEEVGTRKLLSERHPSADPDDHEGRILRAWLRLQSRRLEARSPAFAAVLAHDGAELLVRIEARRVMALLPPALPLSDWLAMLPDEPPREGRAEQIIRLAQAGDLEAVQKLAAAPTAGQLVEGLQLLGLLEASGGLWHLGRPLVQSALQQLVTARLLTAGWEGVGALLLSPDHVKDALDALLASCLQDPARPGPVALAELERMLGQADVSDPRGAAAIDGVCRALAVALLSERAVAKTTLTLAWRQLEASSLRPWAHGLPQPLIGLAERPRLPNHESVGIGSQDVRYLAALAVSHALHEAGTRLATTPVSPWAGQVDEATSELAWEGLRRAATALGKVSVGAQLPPWPESLGWCDRVAAHLIAADLLPQQRTAGLGSGEVLVRALSGRWQRHDLLNEALRLPLGLAPLRATCQRHAVDEQELLAWCWTRWVSQDGNAPPFAWCVGHADAARKAEGALLWSALPPGVFTPERLHLVSMSRAGWPHIRREAWVHLLSLVLVSGDGSWRTDEEWFHAAPVDLVLEAGIAGRLELNATLLTNTLWARDPHRCLQAIDDLARAAAPVSGPATQKLSASQILGLIYRAPDEFEGAVLDRVAAWLSDGESYRGQPCQAEIAGYLMRRIDRRTTHWQRAFAMLVGVRAELQTEARGTEPC